MRDRRLPRVVRLGRLLRVRRRRQLLHVRSRCQLLHVGGCLLLGNHRTGLGGLGGLRGLHLRGRQVW